LKIITKKLPSNHNLFLFGDDHIGTTLRHRKGFEKLLHMMNSEYEGCNNNFGVHHGDFMDAITIDDRRFYPETTEDIIPMKQLEYAINLYQPIKHKLLVILEGNHPLKLWRFGKLTEMLCNSLGVTYGTWTAKLNIRTTRSQLMYKSFHTHGRKSITSTADDPKRRIVNQRLILKRQLKFKMGDAILQCKGHAHKLIICGPEPDLYLTDDGEKIHHHHTMDEVDQTDTCIHPDHRYYICTGSFLKLYGENVSGYAEIGEYDPIELGFAIAKVRNRKLVGVDSVYLD